MTTAELKHQHRPHESIDHLGSGYYWHRCTCGEVGRSPLSQRPSGKIDMDWGPVEWGATPPVLPSWIDCTDPNHYPAIVKLTTHLYFDRAGQPIDSRLWCELFENIDYRTIASTLVHGRDAVAVFEVKTYWNGIREFPDGFVRPRIFATVTRLVLSCGMSGTIDEVGRYASEDEALAGHAAIVGNLEVLASIGEPVPVPDDEVDP